MVSKAILAVVLVMAIAMETGVTIATATSNGIHNGVVGPAKEGQVDDDSITGGGKVLYRGQPGGRW